MKEFLRVLSAVVIVLCCITGYALINFYDSGNEEAGVALLQLMYDYQSIEEVFDREETLKALCTEEVYTQLSSNSKERLESAWGRTANIPTRVRVLFVRPGFIVYALENELVSKYDLWCINYEIDHGLFSEVREYELVSVLDGGRGGFFR